MNKEMKNELAVTNTSTNEIVLYQPNETIQLEVRLQDETVWLNQQQIAVLFGTQRQAITKHLKNIFESGELERQATCSILELVQKEGNRMVRRNVEIYNLDVIISAYCEAGSCLCQSLQSATYPHSHHRGSGRRLAQIPFAPIAA